MLDAEKVDKALREVIARLDYDIHKSLECDESDGTDTYHEWVRIFIEEYDGTAKY